MTDGGVSPPSRFSMILSFRSSVHDNITYEACGNRSFIKVRTSLQVYLRKKLIDVQNIVR